MIVSACRNSLLTLTLRFHLSFHAYTPINFSAVILENFSEVTSGDTQSIEKEKLDEFVEVWNTLDRSASMLFHPLDRCPLKY